MTTALDFTQTGQTILLAQILNDNPDCGLSAANCVFTYPIPNPDAVADGYDTLIRIDPIQGEGFFESFIYKYNKIDLASVFEGATTSFDKGSAVQLSDLIATINESATINLAAPVLADPANNIKAAPGDFNDLKLPQPTGPGVPVNFILTAAPMSFIYKGDVILTLTTTYKTIASVLTTPSTGLVFTRPVVAS
ncbi:hypothetical protein [Paraburkholderia sp. BCC1886]|uniref:DUF7941 domain-family protein n=1 Tax=Paraburkholderia sp. BCC1886 TaxID=2562670 RepID=UPI001183EACF|nr:hypothetical protein [Paraburkholderia sp. BCC1886]